MCLEPEPHYVRAVRAGHAQGKGTRHRHYLVHAPEWHERRQVWVPQGRCRPHLRPQNTSLRLHATLVRTSWPPAHGLKGHISAQDRLPTSPLVHGIHTDQAAHGQKKPRVAATSMGGSRDYALCRQGNARRAFTHVAGVPRAGWVTARTLPRARPRARRRRRSTPDGRPDAFRATATR